MKHNKEENNRRVSYFIHF